MRFLILSDIHGNLEALRAVLADAGSDAYDQILNCGDLVGYGADPNAVTDWCRLHTPAVVRGNHDKACATLEKMEWFNPLARASALWTNSILSEENWRYLQNLPKGPKAVNGFQILHGSPIDEDEYLIEVEDVRHVAPFLDFGVSFFGHTHLQGGFMVHRNGIKKIAPFDGKRKIYALEDDIAYLINPGSVGQPRDNDPRAAYAIYDVVQNIVEFRRTVYDIKAAQKKIRDAGLPDLLAARLEFGQ